jgi:hypothetical protein
LKKFDIEDEILKNDIRENIERYSRIVSGFKNIESYWEKILDNDIEKEISDDWNW